MNRVHSILLLLLLQFSALPAQEVLLSDPQVPLLRHARVAPTHAPTRTARTTAAPFPFFDDFSHDSLAPSSIHWDIPVPGTFARNFVPGVSTRKGTNVPSKGVCTFDGASFEGDMYENAIAYGMADSLVSNSFDLSAHTPGDSLYLSFFVQRGGAGEAPEVGDSLILYFDSTGNYTYERVWAIAGTGTSESTFQLIMVPVAAARYFHGNFRFRFVNFGSLNGEFDIWHIDYVVFDEGRSVSDNQFSDPSPAFVTQSPLGIWTYIPRDHYVLSAATDTPAVQLANAGNPAMNASAAATITDPVGGQVLTGTTTVNLGATTLPAFGHATVSAGAFSDQGASMANYGAIQMRTTLTAAGDLHPENNTLDFLCGIDSVLAMDDGVSDFAYGQTAPRAYCQEFRIPAPDTLTAVWIYFTPYVYYNSTNGQSTSLENKNFRLTVWDTLVVDSFLVQTSSGMNVSYDSSLNSFKRYAFNNPPVVNTQFWVGIRQVDQMPLGVGFDRHGPSGRLYFEAGNGDFVLSTNQGCMMVRPEFARAKAPVIGMPEAAAPTPALALGPNPWHGGPLHLRLENLPAHRNATVTLYDVTGAQVAARAWPSAQPHMDLNLPEGLSAGIYLLTVNGIAQGGKPFAIARRLVVE